MIKYTVPYFDNLDNQCRIDIDVPGYDNTQEVYVRENVIDGFRLNVDGTITKDAAISWTNYLPIRTGGDIVITGLESNFTNKWFFDSQFNFISVYNDGNGSTTIDSTDIPINAAYIGINVRNDNNSTDSRETLSVVASSNSLITQLRSVQKSAFILSYNNDSMDKYDPVIESSARMSLYSTGLDVEELQAAGDRDIVASWYKNDILKWRGFIVPDGIQRMLMWDPYRVDLVATDGLNLMRGVEFQYRNYLENRSVLSYLVDILHGELTGGFQVDGLPIRWINSLTNSAYPTDDVINSANLLINFLGIIDYDQIDDNLPLLGSAKRDIYWILENIMFAFGMRIYQSGGKWIVERVNDVVTGSYSWSEIDGQENITSGTANVNKSISRGGDYRFINEDSVIMVEPGLKSCKVTYEQVQLPKGIVPNGDFDITTPQRNDINDPPDAQIQDWVWITKPTGAPYTYWWDDYTINPALTDNGIYGNSISSLGDPGAVSGTESFSALYNSEHGGFAIPIDNRIWQEINIRFKYMIHFYDGVLPEPPVRIFIWFIQNQFATGNALDFKWLTQYGYWKGFTGDEPIIAAKVGDPDDIVNQLNEVVQINFKQDRGINLPYNSSDATFPSENIRDSDGEIIPGRLTGITVGLDGGSEVHQTRFDDLEITVPSLNEIWEAENTGSQHTGTKEMTQRISSAYTGFYLANITKHWSQTYKDYQFIDVVPDGPDCEGPLSKILANGVMRNSASPSKIFQGSIYGDFEFGEIYSIQTINGKFMPLSCEYNSETGITNLTAIESRNNSVTLLDKHYTTE